MEKVRVHEIAKELGIASKDVLNEAKQMGIDVKSAQSIVTMEQAETIVNYIINGAPVEAQKTKIMVKKEKNIISNTLIKEQKAQIPISQIQKDTGLNKNELILKAKTLNINITTKTRSIPHYQYQKIINSIHISINEIAKVHNLTLEAVNNYIKKLNIKLQNSNTITPTESKQITNYICQEDKETYKNKNEISQEKMKFSSLAMEYKFDYKNILLKGVPGTGKSKTLDDIIKKNFKINNEENTLRLNVHSASSNTDLMQGIGINSNNGDIEYREKQGLILNFIQKATFNPLQPFVLILEEIQENSLNELIGDLIYLIESDKRVKNIKPDDESYTYDELVNHIIHQNHDTQIIKMPNLVNYKSSYKKMLLPDNFYIFCTSNYRDDKKVIEDNLLRRFEVIEIYPKYKLDIGDAFLNEDVSDFLKNLNDSIVAVCHKNGEIHPDRFMIGHSIWLNVNKKKDFNKAFLKVITEFKDIKDFHFEDFKKITENLEFPFGIENNYENYQTWIKDIQKDCYSFLV